MEMAINITLPPIDLKFPRDLYRKYYKELNERAGLYFFYDRNKKLLYIGQTKNLYARLKQHFAGHDNSRWFYGDINEVHVCYVEDPLERELYETYAINKLHPSYNTSKVFYRPKTSEEIEKEDLINQLRDERRQLVDENLQIQEYFDDMLFYDIDDMDYEEWEKWGELERNRRRIREIEEEIRKIKRK